MPRAASQSRSDGGKGFAGDQCAPQRIELHAQFV